MGNVARLFAAALVAVAAARDLPNLGPSFRQDIERELREAASRAGEVARDRRNHPQGSVRTVTFEDFDAIYEARKHQSPEDSLGTESIQITVPCKGCSTQEAEVNDLVLNVTLAPHPWFKFPVVSLNDLDIFTGPQDNDPRRPSKYCTTANVVPEGTLFRDAVDLSRQYGPASVCTPTITFRDTFAWRMRGGKEDPEVAKLGLQAVHMYLGIDHVNFKPALVRGIEVIILCRGGLPVKLQGVRYFVPNPDPWDVCEENDCQTRTGIVNVRDNLMKLSPRRQLRLLEGGEGLWFDHVPDSVAVEADEDEMIVVSMSDDVSIEFDQVSRAGDLEYVDSQGRLPPHEEHESDEDQLIADDGFIMLDDTRVDSDPEYVDYQDREHSFEDHKYVSVQPHSIKEPIHKLADNRPPPANAGYMTKKVDSSELVVESKSTVVSVPCLNCRTAKSSCNDILLNFTTGPGISLDTLQLRGNLQLGGNLQLDSNVIYPPSLANAAGIRRPTPYPMVYAIPKNGAGGCTEDNLQNCVQQQVTGYKMVRSPTRELRVAILSLDHRPVRVPTIYLWPYPLSEVNRLNRFGIESVSYDAVDEFCEPTVQENLGLRIRRITSGYRGLSAKVQVVIILLLGVVAFPLATLLWCITVVVFRVTLLLLRSIGMLCRSNREGTIRLEGEETWAYNGGDAKVAIDDETSSEADIV